MAKYGQFESYEPATDVADDAFRFRLGDGKKVLMSGSAAENLRKGNRVFVEGRFKTRQFEGRDGQMRTSLEITADSVVNLEKRTRDDDGGQFAAPVASGAPAGGSSNGPRGGMDDPDLDDLPF